MVRLVTRSHPGFLARLICGTWCLLCVAGQVCGDQSQGAVFLREFTLIRRESLHEDFLSDFLNSHKTEDP
ncbi:rCG63594, partial [Rattus norvegicus]